MDWDPQKYAQYEDERSRPFRDLTDRIRADAPQVVVDLGCGTGALTALLAQRWPGAKVSGIDSSPEMVAGAVPGVAVRHESIADWLFTGDVVVSNAALQWVPGQLELLTQWASLVPDGGWLAWQVPGNFDSATHVLLRELAAAWGVADVLRHHDMPTTAQYAAVLLGAGLQADVWETTYLHVLSGPDPVLNWMRGTGLRPVLGALAPADRAEFEAVYGAALRAAYPDAILPYRRLFAVGHRA